VKKTRHSKSSARKAGREVIVLFIRAIDGGSFAILKFSAEQFAIIKSAAAGEEMTLEQFFKQAIARLVERTLR
jgi:hypothetical protein